ncbi:hypothetical protein [Prosthecomicrobium hirschii]|uniref:hypothetical protein n=1 Tax=Prosthecodimorpha hirschii TaxID=665126 RepID=UPI00221F2B04|nr:hypothetical protein [Prosthecomicrobium hirschii]MCW1843773.1 hypothetical protein [Prosthecomicrobium hirschii]
MSTVDRPATPASRGRAVTYWYEEGDNFRNLVGLGWDLRSVFQPVDRFLRLIRSAGYTRIMPTVVIYGAQMYPSRFHFTFNDRRRVTTAALMLAARRYGLSVVPEFHPRADKIQWMVRRQEDLDRLLLQSRRGATNHFDAAGR